MSKHNSSNIKMMKHVNDDNAEMREKKVMVMMKRWVNTTTATSK